MQRHAQVLASPPWLPALDGVVGVGSVGSVGRRERGHPGDRAAGGRRACLTSRARESCTPDDTWRLRRDSPGRPALRKLDRERGRQRCGANRAVPLRDIGKRGRMGNGGEESSGWGRDWSGGTGGGCSRGGPGEPFQTRSPNAKALTPSRGTHDLCTVVCLEDACHLQHRDPGHGDRAQQNQDAEEERQEGLAARALHGFGEHLRA